MKTDSQPGKDVDESSPGDGLDDAVVVVHDGQELGVVALVRGAEHKPADDVSDGPHQNRAEI